MVSSASDDFPEPDGPQKTLIFSRGNFADTFFRLCWHAPSTHRCVMYSVGWSAWPFGWADFFLALPFPFFDFTPRIGARASPVYDSATFATCSGVPVATI